jgi:hypothetical protein
MPCHNRPDKSGVRGTHQIETLLLTRLARSRKISIRFLDHLPDSPIACSHTQIKFCRPNHKLHRRPSICLDLLRSIWRSYRWSQCITAHYRPRLYRSGTTCCRYARSRRGGDQRSSSDGYKNLDLNCFPLAKVHGKRALPSSWPPTDPTLSNTVTSLDHPPMHCVRIRLLQTVETKHDSPPAVPPSSVNLVL